MNVQISNKTIERKGVFVDDAQVIVTITYDEYNPQEMSAKVTLVETQPNRHRNVERELRADEAGNLHLRESIGGEEIVSLTGVHGLSVKGYNAKLDVEGYELGFTHAPIEKIERVIVLIDLTPGEILSGNFQRSLSYDGTITCEQLRAERIEWNSTHGMAWAEERHSYENVQVGDNSAIVQIARPQIVYDIVVGLDVSSATLKDEILREVEDVALVLSLCSRKMVSWYKAEFILEGKTEDPYRPSLVARRKRYARSYPEYQQPSVGHENLASGGLADLCVRLRDSDISESLRRSIVFLVSSHADGTVEQKFFLVFAALDAFCDGFCETDDSAQKIPSNVWKRIEKSLRAALGELKEADKQYSETIKRKLPELNRPAAAEKIAHCCTALAATTDDLWQREGFEVGLHKALTARNVLFHTADAGDPLMLHDDCVRMQILVERLVFSSLNWTEDKIFHWYDRSLAAMNSFND